jgi:propanol-preferring alcohol dehydrogenase
MVDVGKPMQLVDVPAPEIREGNEKDENQVIVRVKACGLCGTDRHHLEGTASVARLPMILGHEIAGVVEAVGGAVSTGRLSSPIFEPGDRVTVNNVISCGECHACLRGRANFCEEGLMFGRHVDGGLAEFVKVPVRNLVRLPDDISFDVGAVLGCAAATAYHALNIGHVAVSDCVVVWGTGGVGLSLILLAREISGAFPIVAVGRNDRTLALARKFGADETINVMNEDPVRRLRKITGGHGADIVYDTAGITETDEKGTLITLSSLGVGGSLIVVATYRHPVTLQPHDELGIFEKRFTGSCGNLHHELVELTDLVAGRRLDFGRLISRRIGLEEVNGLVREWQESGGVPRVVVAF